MTKLLGGMALVAVLALAGCEPPPPPRPVVVAPVPEAGGVALFARVDRNNDAYIDFVEFQALQRIRFRRLDVDGNGMLGPAELAQAPGDPVDRRDANNDGVVTEAEFVGSGAVIMARLDVNRDGVLSRDEFSRAMPFMTGRA